METSGNIPLMSQSEKDNAPWNNYLEDEEQEVMVTVSVTYSKTCLINVIGDYDDGELRYEARRQALAALSKVADTEEWTEDDFEVVEENE